MGCSPLRRFAVVSSLPEDLMPEADWPLKRRRPVKNFNVVAIYQVSNVRGPIMRNSGQASALGVNTPHDNWYVPALT